MQEEKQFAVIGLNHCRRRGGRIQVVGHRKQVAIVLTRSERIPFLQGDPPHHRQQQDNNDGLDSLTRQAPASQQPSQTPCQERHIESAREIAQQRCREWRSQEQSGQGITRFTGAEKRKPGQPAPGQQQQHDVHRLLDRCLADGTRRSPQTPGGIGKSERILRPAYEQVLHGLQANGRHKHQRNGCCHSVYGGMRHDVSGQQPILACDQQPTPAPCTDQGHGQPADNRPIAAEGHEQHGPH